jgi:hypothetical protein
VTVAAELMVSILAAGLVLGLSSFESTNCGTVWMS